MKNHRGYFPECNSYVCEGCPRGATCKFAERPGVGAAPEEGAPARRERRMCLVFIAGALSGPEVQYLENVARMAQVWRKLVEAGYACVCPAADLLLGLVSPFGWPASMYKKQSMELLRRCDVVFVTNPDDVTPGVAAEIAEAERLRIPVAYSVAALNEVERVLASG